MGLSSCRFTLAYGECIQYCPLCIAIFVAVVKEAPNHMKAKLVLASTSPKRKNFTMLGLDFTVQAADIAEVVVPGLPPEETVMSLAAQKAAAVKECMGDS